MVEHIHTVELFGRTQYWQKTALANCLVCPWRYEAPTYIEVAEEAIRHQREMIKIA